jgi:hypothetical protein
MSYTEESETDEVSNGTALGRVLRRSLKMKRGRTEKAIFRGGEGWSKRAESVIASYNKLLEAYDRLATKTDEVNQDALVKFKDLTNRVKAIEDKRVDNTKKAREKHKQEIEALTLDVEKMELEFEEDVEFSGIPLPPPPLPPPPPPLEVEPEDPVPEIQGDPLDTTKMEDLLKDAHQALHRAASHYGGLSFCTEHVDEFPKGDQTEIKNLGKYNAKRIELLGKLKKGDATEEDIAKLSDQIRGLHAGFGKSVTDTMDDKHAKSERAVKACGLGREAEEAIAELVTQSRSIKITDAPNPYWAPAPPKDRTRWTREDQACWDKAVEKWENSGMNGAVKEMFNPANRYVHVDGDEAVNAAKTASAKVARALVREVDLEGLKRNLREKEGNEQYQKVKKTKGEEIEETAIQNHMLEWYGDGGAAMLKGEDLAAVAVKWRKGEISGEGVSESLMHQITVVAEQVLSEFRDNGLDAAVENAINDEVEKIIGIKAHAKRARMIEDETMTQGDYWVELGRRAKSADVGRCFSCAGVAVQSLVMNPAFDGQTIESVGAVSYDHHFVLLGRTGLEVGSTSPPGMDSKVLVIDVWQANQGEDPPAVTWENFTYNSETALKVFSVMKPGDRQALRDRCLEYANEE